ncbi:hypothetical protein Btru_053814 [Bulinus truncatus]|nr:hypothetical protein Btru_053814 [Bulinus truncatus]
MLDIKEDKSLSEGQKGTIHSGHFMVSRVHDVNNDDEDEEEVQSPFIDDSKGFDFLSASKEISKTYNFGGIANNQTAVAIDASLNKLFECMSLAYSGKITSPRWKQFRGLHVSQKQRIRLNNLIWREWHLQYICQRSPNVCQFACPLSDDIHSKPEAVVLEGKYWKRRLDTVTAEYKKWRRYFKERIRNQQNVNIQDTSRLNENDLLERVKDVTFISHLSSNYTSNTDLNLLQADIMEMDFTNELFASLNQPFAFPNPRELSQLQLGCADLIQPGLIQLQPNLEEFMDIDTMQELLQSSRLNSNFSSSDNSSTVDAGQGNVNNNAMTLEDFFSTPSIGTGASTTDSYSSSTMVGSRNNFNHINNNFLIDQQQNISFQLSSDSGQFSLDPDTIVLSPTQNVNSGQQTYTLIPSSLYQNLTFGNALIQKPIASATITQDLLTQMLQQQQHSPQELSVVNRRTQQSPVPIQPALAPSQQLRRLQQQSPIQQILYQQQSPSALSPLLAQSLSSVRPQSQPSPIRQTPQRKTNKGAKVNSNQLPQDASASGVISGLAARVVNDSNANSKKREVQFAVPIKPVVAPQRKNRVIAPAPPVQPPTPPSSAHLAPAQTPSMQASYLAELLKNGTYPGALISVKKEPAQSQPLSMAKSPITTTTNHFQQIRPSFNKGISHQVTTQNIVQTANTQIQPAMPLLTSTSAIDVSKISKQKFKESLMQNTISSVPSIPSACKDLSVRYSPKCDPDASSSLVSPVSLLPASPDSSPLLVKRSPSPNLLMDTSPLLLKRSSSPNLLMDTSPLMVKRSASPSLLMDTVDPVSPYSSMAMSPSALGAPDSPGSSDSSFHKDPRRVAHLSAEQKRRCNLKTGFDMLQQLVPSLAQNPKVSKATMLQKTAEFCKKLKAERLQMQKEAAILKKEIESLNSAISIVQSQLPETGVPVTRQRKDQMREMFDEYVRVRTRENWKFWIFSVIMNTLYDSYCNTVSTSSMEDLCRTSLTWLDQSCSLVTLRPNVLNALRRLSTTTSILTEPQKVKEQALQAVSKQSRVTSNLLPK